MNRRKKTMDKAVVSKKIFEPNELPVSAGGPNELRSINLINVTDIRTLHNSIEGTNEKNVSGPLTSFEMIAEFKKHLQPRWQTGDCMPHVPNAEHNLRMALSIRPCPPKTMVKDDETYQPSRTHVPKFLPSQMAAPMLNRPLPPKMLTFGHGKGW